MSGLQDPPRLSKFAAFRRRIDQLRHRLTGRGHSKPPDWYSDRFSAAAQPNPAGPSSVSLTTPHNEQTLRSRLCGRLSVDPTLPSHYRVLVQSNMQWCSSI